MGTFGNAVRGGLSQLGHGIETGFQKGEADGLVSSGANNVSNSQNAFNSEQAGDNQATLNSAAGEETAGNQSSAAALGQQAASDQINQQLSASDLAAKESTAAHSEQEDAINSIASS